MSITVIGAGRIGGTLVAILRELGHEVYVTNAGGPQTLASLSSATGATPVALADLPSSDLVILALPMPAVTDLPSAAISRMQRAAAIVDVSNYVPGVRDAFVAAIETGQAESEWVSEQLDAPVIKALNTVSAASLRDKRRAADRWIAVPVSGDDPHRLELVSQLVRDVGFDAFGAGSLHDSWRQQPGTPVYTADLSLAEAERALFDARPEQTGRWRDQMRGRSIQ